MSLTRVPGQRIDALVGRAGGWRGRLCARGPPLVPFPCWLSRTFEQKAMWPCGKEVTAMKKVALLLVTVPLLLFALPTDGLADGLTEVVVALCVPVPGSGPPTPGFPLPPGPVLVSNASSSAGAPAVTLGGSCAQALADLLSAGFEIVNVTPGPSFQGGAFYTLAKKQ